MNTWRPTSGADVAVRRANMLHRIRQHLDAKKILQVDTAALSFSASSEVQIESFEMTSHLSKDALYLHTSPEFMMKRLLAASWPDIYSISRVFRDGECGNQHQPEFTLVEWYRLDFDLAAIVNDSLELIAAALDAPTLVESAAVVSFRDAFLNAVALDPMCASIDELASAADADDDLRATLGDKRDDWLDLLMTSKVAPKFRSDNLTVVRHYPASQAALARLCPDDAAVADRFEIFMGSLELGNGYVELTDASMLADRIAADQAERKRRSRPIRPHDQALVDALHHGLPECSGVAVGLERLQMIHEMTDDIRNVIPFPFENPNE